CARRTRWSEASEPPCRTSMGAGRSSALRVVRQHDPHALVIGLVDQIALAQPALPLAVLLREDVAVVRLVALEAAGGRALEALRRTLVGLHLRHVRPRGRVSGRLLSGWVTS